MSSINSKVTQELNYTYSMTFQDDMWKTIQTTKALTDKRKYPVVHTPFTSTKKPKLSSCGTQLPPKDSAYNQKYIGFVSLE